MKKDMEVRITKVGETSDAAYPTPLKSAYIPGGGDLNGDVSLPLDYESLGVLVTDICVGRAICLARTQRNGVLCPGVLLSSPVRGIAPAANGRGHLVTTGNSMYRVEPVV